MAFRSDLRDRTRGGAAVEFALVLPLFMALIMGALDYGYFFYEDQIVTNAVREGARAGTLVDPTIPGASGQAQSNALSAATSYLTQNGLGVGGLSADIVFPTPGTQAVQVKVDRPFQSLTGFTSIVVPGKIYALAVMRWQ
jgi:Flp pilus assembly protein TadG